jgi:hypothetical protein
LQAPFLTGANTHVSNLRNVKDKLLSLSRAIEVFAKMYERVESAKQKYSLKTEREQIDFLKQLEVQHMENFVDAHLKLSRARPGRKSRGAAAANGSGGVELISSMTALPFLSNSTCL